MKVRVQFTGGFTFSLKQNNFDLELPEACSVRQAVERILADLEKAGESAQADDMVVSVGHDITDPDDWDDITLEDGQKLVFFPPLLGG